MLDIGVRKLARYWGNLRVIKTLIALGEALLTQSCFSGSRHATRFSVYLNRQSATSKRDSDAIEV